EEEEDEEEEEEKSRRARRRGRSKDVSSGKGKGEDLSHRRSIQGTAVMDDSGDLKPKGGSAGGSASLDLNSLHRTISSDSHFGKLARIINDTKMKFYDSKVFRLYLRLSESVVTQVVLSELLLLVVIICIAVLAQKILLSEKLPGIQFYNLINAVLGLLGKIAIFVGFVFSQVIAKGVTANMLVKSVSGVSITSIVHRYGYHDPERGRTLRRTFMASLFAVEVSLWILGYCMQWQNVASEIGYYSCSLATYNTAPLLYPDLGMYLAGDTEFAQVYNYGMPLGDGVVGGWSSWPNAAPAPSFNVQGPGVVYAVGVNCADPVPVDPSTDDNSGLTHFRLFNEQFWNTSYLAAIEVRMPAGSHDLSDYPDKDVLQECELSVTVGLGNVTYNFITDEWDVLTGGELTYVAVGRDPGLGLESHMAKKYYYGQIANTLNDTNGVYSNITGWIAQHIQVVFDGTSCGSSQGATFCNLLQWSTLPDGLYHTSLQYRGISVAVAAISHYILMQYDYGAPTLCLYLADIGDGIISAPLWASRVVIAVLSVNAFLQLVLICSWLLISIGSVNTDRAARLLDDPLRLLYDLRESLPRLTKSLKQQEHTSASLHQQMQKIIVRFGEIRATRGEKVGSVALDAPQMVLKLRKKRQYE
ncbi:hypothetical protein DFJ73DRAFT_852302, partial [Zopfochytrium polystomum]